MPIYAHLCPSILPHTHTHTHTRARTFQDKNPSPPSYQSAGITADLTISLVFEAMYLHKFEVPATVQAERFLAPHYEDAAKEGANVVHTILTWHDGSLSHLWGSRINACGFDNGMKLIGTEGQIDVVRKIAPLFSKWRQKS